MKHSHRRQMIGNLAALLAAPLALGRVELPVIGSANGAPNDDERRRRLDTRTVSVRPRIAAPKGSVMRRG